MRSGIAGALLLVLVAFLAMANSPTTKDEVVPGPIADADIDTCDIPGYASYTLTDGREIPDSTMNGLISGPLQVDEPYRVLDTMIDIKMTHTWIGDVIVKLYPDPECDGGLDNEDQAIAIMCEPGLYSGCPGLGSCCGCSDDMELAGKYRWSSDAAQPLGEPCSMSGAVPSGCYREAPESSNRLSDIERNDGCWWLVFSDCAPGDVGSLYSWTLHFWITGGEAAEAVTWGRVKTTFRE